jgi:hypothetical protein
MKAKFRTASDRMVLFPDSFHPFPLISNKLDHLVVMVTWHRPLSLEHLLLNILMLDDLYGDPYIRPFDLAAFRAARTGCLVSVTSRKKIQS